MSTEIIYAVAAACLFAAAQVRLFTTRDLLRKVIAVNVLTSGLFVLIVAGAYGAGGVDPVLHAMVLTGLVVSASATALGLALVQGHAAQAGATTLEAAAKAAAGSSGKPDDSTGSQP